MTAATGWNQRADGEKVHLALYKYDACPYCMRVSRALHALAVDVELRDVLREPRWRADLMERTGRTQVPCLFVDDVPLFESADIVDWLQAHFPAR